MKSARGISMEIRANSNIRNYLIIIISLVISSSLVFLLCQCTSNVSLHHFLIATTPAYVITISGHDQRVPVVTALFKNYSNMNLRVFYGVHGYAVYSNEHGQLLTPGERGLRDTMRNFFTMTLQRNYREVYLFEDDAIPHINFTVLYKNLHDRCRQADVLLLGATLWHDTKEQWPRGTCFNADNETFGAFALLIKRSAYVPILNWLDMEEEVAFDFIYPWLQRAGLSVRVAYPPFLVIPDISHRSLVDNNRTGSIEFDVQMRALQHDWHLENYPMSIIPV